MIDLVSKTSNGTDAFLRRELQKLYKHVEIHVNHIARSGKRFVWCECSERINEDQWLFVPKWIKSKLYRTSGEALGEVYERLYKPLPRPHPKVTLTASRHPQTESNPLRDAHEGVPKARAKSRTFFLPNQPTSF